METPLTIADHIRAVLRREGRAVRASEIVEEVTRLMGTSADAVRQELSALKKDRVIGSPRRGFYDLRSTQNGTTEPVPPPEWQVQLDQVLGVLRSISERLSALERQRAAPPKEHGPVAGSRQVADDGIESMIDPASVHSGAAPAPTPGERGLPEPVALARLRGVTLRIFGDATITLDVLAEGPAERIAKDFLELVGPLGAEAEAGQPVHGDVGGER